MIPADTLPLVQLRQLRLRLMATRARLLFVTAATGLAKTAAVLIGAFVAEMTLDYLVRLPWLARACISLPALAGAGWILYREVILPLLRVPGDHAMACAIERELPFFQTRLIASIQLGASKEAKKSALVGALLRETTAMAVGRDFRKTVKTQKLRHALRVLACVVVAAACLAWQWRGLGGILLDRALLLTTRLPSWTQIDQIYCATKLAAGDDLKIDVQASGILPRTGAVIAQSGTTFSEYKLDPAPPHGSIFHAVIRDVPASLTFRVRLNDAESDPIAVTVLSPPVVLAVQCIEACPAYTKLPPEPRPTGDLSLLAGSVLDLAVTANEPLDHASAHLAGLEKDIPLTVEPANPLQARGGIPIPKDGLTGFSLHLIDINGIASRETAVYPIDIIPDRPPTILITHPGPDEVATAGATEIIGFHAEDDFGVASVLLHYVVNQSPEKVISFDLGGDTPRQIDRRFEWQFDSLKLSPGAIIDYWLEAADANNVTGPGRGVTGHARIRIVTPDEKRAELTGRTNDTLDSLTGLTQEEDDLSSKLGAQILAVPQPAP
ncbi:MAG: hypothetical protein ABSE62_11930 [Chthoniobacteraceae bacterium]|jgi:hypothetical protein